MPKVSIKHDCNLCVIMSKDKAVEFLNIKKTEKSFRYNKSVYFLDNTGAYLNSKKNTVVFIYIEGVSLPMSHQYIKTKTEERTITNDMTGKDEKIKIKVIENLKFDSEAIDVILNKELAKMFTKIQPDMSSIFLAIILIFNTILLFANIGMWFI